MDKILRRLIPQGIGFFLMVVGWYISIINVGLDKFMGATIVTRWTVGGLLLILIGAYLPQIWIAILNRMQR
jgi:hypothetical protein